MVVRLAESLRLPLRDRNSLLVSAGFAPVYPETSIDAADLAPTRAALTHILRGYTPYPAVILDRAGTLLAANTAFGAMVEGVDEQLLAHPVNLYRLALHPRGLAPRIRNFAQWSRHVVENLHQAYLRDPDERLAALHAELAAYIPESAGNSPLGFAVPLDLASAHGDLRLMTTVSTFATAVDVTVSELKLEAFLPVDEQTAESLRQAAGQQNDESCRWYLNEAAPERPGAGRTPALTSR